MSTSINLEDEVMEDYLSSRPRVRVSDLREAKRRGEKFAMLTSYDATSAKIFDLAKIPCLLIGDSAAQTVYGYKSTIPITMDEMVPLAKAVASNCQRALVVADLPFGSYQESAQVALRQATRFMKEAQVHAVKLEGGQAFVEHVRLLTSSGIPVMAHIGLTPQSEHALGGYKVQGRDEAAKQLLLAEARALQEAGAFACVIELVPSDVGRLLARELEIPIIGIGAGPDTDGQVLVWHDMAGFSAPKGTAGTYLASSEDEAKQQPAGESLASSAKSDGKKLTLELNRVPKFVKRYANMSQALFEAAISFKNDVKHKTYPSEEHCYK